jgi:hypothetical protein
VPYSYLLVAAFRNESAFAGTCDTHDGDEDIGGPVIVITSAEYVKPSVFPHRGCKPSRKEAAVWRDNDMISDCP